MAPTGSSLGMKTPPAKRRPVARDKVELSPNNRAKCQACGTKISKGEQRCGIVEQNEYGRTQRYFHPDCLPKNLLDRIPSPEQMQNIRLVTQERRELYNDLKSLRSLFAAELGVEHFRIFHDKSLEELVMRMPTTKEELVTIWGIKERKAEHFGDAILTVIKQYQRRRIVKEESKPGTTSSSCKRASKKYKMPAKGNVKDARNGDVNDEVDIGETLSCDEIVRRKFEHAKANGYVISVD